MGSCIGTGPGNDNLPQIFLLYTWTSCRGAGNKHPTPQRNSQPRRDGASSIPNHLIMEEEGRTIALACALLEQLKLIPWRGFIGVHSQSSHLTPAIVRTYMQHADK